MWQNRIYALIIRRILGPYLTPKSKRSLQETLDISLRQGRVTLNSIELDGQVLTKKFLDKKKNNENEEDGSEGKSDSISRHTKNEKGQEISIKKVSIDELNISLFLVYDDDDDDDENKICNNSANENDSRSGGAKLVAKVELNGVHVQIKVDKSSNTTNSTTTKNEVIGSKKSHRTIKSKSHPPPGKDENDASTTASSGFIQSYVQAALDSLKLTLDVQNLSIEIMSYSSQPPSEEKCKTDSFSWLALHLNSLSYKDSTLPPPPPSATTSREDENELESSMDLNNISTSSTKSKVILGKEICFQQLWIEVGTATTSTMINSTNDTKSEKILQSNSAGEILRFNGYATIIATIMKHISSTKTQIDSMERQLEVAIDDILDIQMTPKRIMILRDILVPVKEEKQSSLHKSRDYEPFMSENEVVEAFESTCQRKPSISLHDEDVMDDDDEQDLGLLAHILQQQQIESSSYMSTPRKTSSLSNKFETNDELILNGKSKENSNPVRTIEVDGFFHRNEEGFFNYCKLASSLQADKIESNRDGYDQGVKDDDSMTTTITFYLKEISMKMELSRCPKIIDVYERQLSDVISSRCHDCGSIVLSLVDTNAVMTQTSLHDQSEMSIDFKEFGIYHQKSVNASRRDNLFQFVQNIDVKDPYPPKETFEDQVLAMKFTSFTKFNETEIDLNLILDPILITVENEIVLMFLESYEGVINSSSGDELEKPSNDNKGKSKLSVKCRYISVEIPLKMNEDQNDKVSNNVDNLFRRCGYIYDSSNEIFSPTISFTITDIDMMLQKGNVDSREVDIEIQLILQRSILSLLAPYECDIAKKCRRFDILSIDSETQIDPDAVVKIEFSNMPSMKYKPEVFKKQRAKTFFPSVVPLALVKSSQHCSDDDEQAFGKKFGGTDPNFKRNLRGADPQARMLKESTSCTKNILIQVPSIATDLSLIEKNVLMHVISTAFSGTVKNSDEDATISGENINNRSNAQNQIGVSFKCNQLILSLHHDDREEHKGQNYLQIITFDGLNVYCLQNTHGLRHVRCLSDDVTLYEVKHLRKMNKSFTGISKVSDMCEMLRKRRFDRSNITQSNIVFFRTKLSHPLSPKTPAVLIDLIKARNEDDFDDVESSWHISLYDLTYRYNVDSTWIDNFKSFVVTNSDHGVEKIEERDEENHKVTNIFCTISDFNFDYSSPTYLKKSSRTIIRLGELRVTSNLISPPGPVQTCKVSIGDVSIHLSHKRGRYEDEDVRVSCANLILKPEVILSKRRTTVPHTYDDALFQLESVAIASLDHLEGIFSIQSKSTLDFQQKPSSPNSSSVADSTLTLSIGKLCIFACKDSFEHFTSTVNELILKLTMPTEDELDEMRREYFEKISIDTSKDVQKISNLKQQSVVVDENQRFDDRSLTLNDVMNDGLFSDEKVDQNVVGEETSVLPEVHEGQIDIDRCQESSMELSNHEVIHDFYDYDSKHSPSQFSNYSYDGDMTDCWTAIDHPWNDDPSIPEDQDQTARWYGWEESNVKSEQLMPQLKPSSGTTIVEGKNPSGRQPRIFNRHIPLSAIVDPLAEGDMGISTFADENIGVKMRILITEMNFLCRLFDGYDWPAFSPQLKDENTKSKLLGDLVRGDDSPSLFSDEKEVPQVTQRKQRKPRQPERYFQFTFSGLKMRLDSYHESEKHYLSSCLEMKLKDLNLIETVSSDKLVKLLGEWVNEDDHPRDSNDGLFMMKMVSLLPETKFASDGKLMGNEGHVVVEFLPIRFFIHQIALRFIRQFFKSDYPSGEDNNEIDGKDTENPPDMFFPTFKVKPFDIKVDYKPLEVDRAALKDGSYIQLLNLLPLEDMILRLNGVELRNLTGWGPVLVELACKWLQDVSSTQMHKFLTRTTPLHPFANVGDGVKNCVLIPLKEYRQRGDVKKALRKSTSKLVGVVAYEALSVGAKLTGYAAKKLNKGKKKLLSSSSSLSTEPQSSLLSSSSLSSTRTSSSKSTSAIPRNMGDVSDRAIESLSKGLKEANAKIIIIPYREYQKTGTKGAMKKVVKGIPVAVCAPLSGAVEALSHGLYGASNQLRPDLFEEREASKRFHDEDL